MFYPNRQSVGDQLAERLEPNYKDQEAIVFCLKESGLLSCIELAAQLHGYVYIMQYETVDDPYVITRKLGAVTQTGNFVLNPEITQSEYEYITMNFASVVEEGKRVAFSKINAKQDPNPNFDKQIFNDRHIFLTSDILRDSFQIQIALDILKPYKPRSISGAVGNITSNVSDKFHIDTDGVTYLDVLPNSIFDDAHYFDQPDQYSDEQKIQLANNVSLYWA